jgi:hypothetical protein
VKEEVDEGNDNDDVEDVGDIIPVTNDVLQGVKTREEQDVPLPDPPQPRSASNTRKCENCDKQHDGIYDKQCEVATRLFGKIKTKIGEDANQKFTAFEVFVLVPNLNSLYRQTVSRLESFIKQVQERIDPNSGKKARSFLAGKPAGFVFKSSKALENKTIFGKMEEAIKKRKDTLFLLIHDEAHYGATKEKKGDEATKGGAVDAFINSPEVLRSDNVVTLLVSATPYNLVSYDSRIPEDNVVDWMGPVKKKVDSDSDHDAKPAAKGGGAAAKRAELVGLDTTKPQNASTSAAQVDDQPQASADVKKAAKKPEKRKDKAEYFGLAKYVERTLTMQDKPEFDSEGGFIAADKKFEGILMFDLIDQDKDGFITESEFTVLNDSLKMELSQSWSSSLDGKISRSDWDTYFAECAESRKEITTSLKAGQVWRCVGTSKPTKRARDGKETFKELSHTDENAKKLAEELNRKTAFTPQEWAAFGIKNLDKNTFIKAGDAFFQPVDADEQRCNSLIDEYCMFMEQVVDGEAASRQGNKAPVSKYTERIVRDLLNSVGGRGCMVLVRVTEKKFGLLIANRLRECRKKLGLQQKFAVVLDIEDAKGEPAAKKTATKPPQEGGKGKAKADTASENNRRGRTLKDLLREDSSQTVREQGRDWVTRLGLLNGWDAEMGPLSKQIKDQQNISVKESLKAELKALEAKPVCYEDLKDLPCFLILCQKGKMGDTFPTSLKYYDMRMMYAISCEYRAPVEQDLGRAFRYAEPESCPLVLVGQECANQLDASRTDCAELLGLKPDEKMNARTATSKYPRTEFEPDDPGVRHDLKVYREAWKAAKEHYDFDNGTDNQNPRRFLLIGRPQIGKTGAFLRLLELLWDWCSSGQVQEPLPEPEDPDELYSRNPVLYEKRRQDESSDDDDGGQEWDATKSHGLYPDFSSLNSEKFVDKPSTGKYGDPRDNVLKSWYLCEGPSGNLTHDPQTYVDQLVGIFDPGVYPDCTQCAKRHYQKEIHPRANATSTASSNSSEQTSCPLSSIGGASASSTEDEVSKRAAGVGETHSQSVPTLTTRFQHRKVTDRDGSPVEYKEFKIRLVPPHGYTPEDTIGTLSVPADVVGDWFVEPDDDMIDHHIRIKEVPVDKQMIPFPIFMPTRGRADCGFLVRDEKLLSLADN